MGVGEGPGLILSPPSLPLLEIPKVSSFRDFHGVKCVLHGIPNFRINIQILGVHQISFLLSVGPSALQLLQFCYFYLLFLLFLKYVCAI